MTILTTSAMAQTDDATTRQHIVGDAVLGNQGYELLEHLTTQFQGRMAGTPGNTQSMDYLEDLLKELGIATHRERFDVPGWRRGTDRVMVSKPAERPLRAAALGYVAAHKAVEAELAYIANTDFDQLNPEQTRGSIGLAAPNIRFSHGEYERLAQDFGLVGVLLTNRVDGGQLLARTANHEGYPCPLPVYSITMEDGKWLRRLHETDADPVLRLETTSDCVDLSVENLVATLPGRSEQKIVLGGHFDSWDLGQGAMDNGLGIAQLFEAARLLWAHSAENEHTVEIVFFNAEEWGLWGSRDYVDRNDLTDVRVMLNLDMVGRPIAINAMGFAEMLPMLGAFAAGLGSWSLEPKIANKTWLGSDHHPFILHGVPAITLNAPIGEDQVRYYHDPSDTFDKIDAEMLGRASAIVALLAHELANDTSSGLRQYNEEETAELFRSAGLENRMRKAGQWPFGEAATSP
ncbi:MAG: M28 family peptidase [Gemmatimonadetes bacterium]|nr:M28 family peptidase [Gemmatimonadota bacterium]MBT7859180.1 M28 family peptidase [Gemmatimonadota bacterium]